MKDAMKKLANPELERLLIAGLIINPNVYWDIKHAIRPEVFTVALHRKMYEELTDMIEAGSSATVTLLCSRLPEQEKDEHGNEVSVRSYISVCLDRADGLNPLEVYEELADLGSKRRLLRAADEVTKTITKGDKKADEIAADMESHALDVMNVSTPNHPRRLSEMAPAVIKNSRLAAETGDVKGVRTGLAALDEMLGLILPNDFGCILASQSDGKTSLAQQIGIHVSQTKPVLFISMEMSAEELTVREVSAASGISAGEIQEGRVSSFDFEAVEGSESRLNTYNFFVHDAKKMTVRQIKSVAVGMKRTNGLGMLIIDQLDKIKPERWTNDKFDRRAEITSDLKDMAKELSVPIIVLAQRTRTAQRSSDEVPDINDAEFPSLEKDVDWFLGLWRKESWLQKHKPDPSREAEHSDWKVKMQEVRDRADVIMLKHRRGQRFARKQIRWNGKITRFEDM